MQNNDYKNLYEPILISNTLLKHDLTIFNSPYIYGSPPNKMWFSYLKQCQTFSLRSVITEYNFSHTFLLQILLLFFFLQSAYISDFSQKKEMYNYGCIIKKRFYYMPLNSLDTRNHYRQCHGFWHKKVRFQNFEKTVGLDLYLK